MRGLRQVPAVELLAGQVGRRIRARRALPCVWPWAVPRPQVYWNDGRAPLVAAGMRGYQRPPTDRPHLSRSRHRRIRHRRSRRSSRRSERERDREDSAARAAAPADVRAVRLEVLAGQGVGLFGEILRPPRLGQRRLDVRMGEGARLLKVSPRLSRAGSARPSPCPGAGRHRSSPPGCSSPRLPEAGLPGAAARGRAAPRPGGSAP